MSRIYGPMRRLGAQASVGVRFAISTRLGISALALAIWVAAGFQAWASELHMHGGTFILDGFLAADLLAIGPSSALRGDGIVEGSIEVSGAIAPGFLGGAVGTQTVRGAATFLPGSQFRCDVVGHAALDRLAVGGTVSGDCEVVFSAADGAYPVGEILVQGAPDSDFDGFHPSDPYTWRMETTGSLALALTHLRGDTDADGMPDWWELAHFAHDRTNATPDGNADGDDAPNGEEYSANTDPDDFFSCFQLTALRRSSPTTALVSWASAPGRRYTVLQITNLPAGARNPVAVVTDYGQPEATWTNPADPNPSGFYAITAEENISF